MKKVLVTGSAGFIGFHLSQLLLAEGFAVHGFDGMTDYYDVRLKERRQQMLLQNEGFSVTNAMLEEAGTLARAVEDFAPDVIVHLAAQAGVRYSLENPRAYIESNVVGTFNVMEAARAQGVDHLLMASTSSVYGANTDMPFVETQRTDTPLTIYAATKKANEAMGHSYAHIYGLPVTMFRFFTVYGPWGRPDMALFKFTKGILEGLPIDIYNHGEMYRDFTYVTDLVRGIRLLIDAVPPKPDTGDGPRPEGTNNAPVPDTTYAPVPDTTYAPVPDTTYAPVPGDSLSPAAPFRVVNIGNSDKVRLMDFVEEIERCLGRRAQLNMMPMQTGDVPATWADAQLLERLTGYRPQTDFREGIAQFVAWFRDYYNV